jgi:hypothetical protein
MAEMRTALAIMAEMRTALAIMVKRSALTLTVKTGTRSMHRRSFFTAETRSWLALAVIVVELVKHVC